MMRMTGDDVVVRWDVRQDDDDGMTMMTVAR